MARTIHRSSFEVDAVDTLPMVEMDAELNDDVWAEAMRMERADSSDEISKPEPF